MSYQEFKHKRQTDKYQITNFDIFDSCDYGKNNHDSKWNAYNTWLNTKHLGQNQSSCLDSLEFERLKNSYYDSLIVVPFIELLKSLVKIGADPKATVDKLEFYRELDKHKQHLVLVQDQREGLNVV